MQVEIQDSLYHSLIYYPIMEDLKRGLIYRLSKTFTCEEVNFIMDQVDDVLVGYDVHKKCNLPSVSSDMDSVGQYIQQKLLEGVSKSTAKVYLSRIKSFVSSITTPLNEIAENDVRLYLQALKIQKNHSDVSVEGARVILHGFFAWLKENGRVPIDPCRRIKKAKFTPNRRKPLTDKEMELIRYACRNNLRDSALIEFLYSPGCRAGEIYNLKLSDMNLETKEVEVLGKGNKRRTVFINARAESAIRRYLKERKKASEYLFPGRKRGLTTDGVEYALADIGRRAGLERKLKPHEIRHTMATNALFQGMPLEEVKELLGHNSIETTLIYAEINKEKLKQDHKKYLTA